jgi:hypothetical protein
MSAMFCPDYSTCKRGARRTLFWFIGQNVFGVFWTAQRNTPSDSRQTGSMVHDTRWRVISVMVQTFFCTNACNVRFSPLNKRYTSYFQRSLYEAIFHFCLFFFFTWLRNVKTDICAYIHDSSLICKWWSRDQLTCPTFMFWHALSKASSFSVKLK